MPRGSGGKLDRRVVRAADAALAQRRFVTAIDVLVGLGWLEPRRVDDWRQGRVPYLEAVVIASLGKISTAMKVFRQWAAARGLAPSETAYVARTRDRRPLRFSKSGDEGIERAYRTHWVSPELSERKRERLAERQRRPPDLVVVSPVKEWTCTVCGSDEGGWLIMEDSGPVCMACADMDHLVFLPSGDAAVTRRANKNSRLSAVVVRFSRARKRYERQGILVEEDALERAEQQCLADEESRARRRDRDAERSPARGGPGGHGAESAARATSSTPTSPDNAPSASALPLCGSLSRSPTQTSRPFVSHDRLGCARTCPLRHRRGRRGSDIGEGT
ncbi:MAG: hypothetical protein ACLP4R_01890 [Solirubrobacteraceae bacterium]